MHLLAQNREKNESRYAYRRAFVIPAIKPVPRRRRGNEDKDRRTRMRSFFLLFFELNRFNAYHVDPLGSLMASRYTRKRKKRDNSSTRGYISNNLNMDGTTSTLFILRKIYVEVACVYIYTDKKLFVV